MLTVGGCAAACSGLRRVQWALPERIRSVCLACLHLQKVVVFVRGPLANATCEGPSLVQVVV